MNRGETPDQWEAEARVKGGAHASRKALDYPNINDNAWIIWSGNEHKWPDARRRTSFLSTKKTDVMRGFALFTIFWQDAMIFDTYVEAVTWLAQQADKRPQPYNVNVTTVADLKKQRGYA